MQDPLETPTVSFSLTATKKVPNVFPSVDVPYRLAIVGEAPGSDEEAHGQPFVGASGNFLNAILAQSNILRAGCFIGNVCQYRPPGNDIKEFGFDPAKKKFGNDKIQEGWLQLQADLDTFRPHCILALGNTPLYFLTNRTGINNWRGSILAGSKGKLVPALHPAAVLREYPNWVLLRFDATRARAEAETDVLSLPQRILELDLSANEICHRLDNWPAGQLLSFDIEGGLDAFPCCSVAGESNCGFIIAWSRHNEREQGCIAVSLSRVLYRIDVPKVLQNSLYDRFVLAYGYNMLIRNVREDTMDKSWAIYPELKKSLAMITSIWTREPYYKFEGKKGNKGGDLSATEERDQYHRYCIKDSCVTLESSLAMDQALSPQERRHYEFNVALKNPLLYMQLRGFRYDTALATSKRADCKARMAEVYARIELQTPAHQWTKKEFSSNLLGSKGFISAQRLAIALERKGYPQQFKGRGPNRKVTADKEALLNLGKKYTDDPYLSDILLHKKYEGVLKTLEWEVDPSDGRMKCCYNQFSKGEDDSDEGGGSTETGRLRCGKSIIPAGDDTVGGNLQTVTKKLRCLYLADEDHWLFQCDLSGADGWTVAARCLAHGDPTMWDDYNYGLKPAKIIALMIKYGAAVNTWTREQIKVACKEVDSEGVEYFVCKVVQHGSNYGMQEATMQMNVMIKSYGLTGKPIYVEKSFCAMVQRFYFVRYPGLYQWHNWAKQQVRDGHNLTSASGHTRKFFGRRKAWDNKTKSWDADHDTWKEFLADEPQENTTYATNLALHRLWHDTENRTSVSRTTMPMSVGVSQHSGLIIEPLHQVHDALIGQFPKSHTSWAVDKIRGYFQNTLKIANSEVIIPFEGAYGPSWGELGTAYGGGEI